jgi:hypothetical protein
LGGALPSTPVIEISFGKVAQRIVDFPIDVDQLGHKGASASGGCAPRNADLCGSRLSSRGFDCGDPPADFVPTYIGRQKQVRLECEQHSRLPRLPVVFWPLRRRAPDNIGLLHLPPYSPELNLVENVWEFLRHNDLSNRV